MRNRAIFVATAKEREEHNRPIECGIEVSAVIRVVDLLCSSPRSCPPLLSTTKTTATTATTATTTKTTTTTMQPLRPNPN